MGLYVSRLSFYWCNVAEMFKKKRNWGALGHCAGNILKVPVKQSILILFLRAWVKESCRESEILSPSFMLFLNIDSSN